MSLESHSAEMNNFLFIEKKIESKQTTSLNLGSGKQVMSF